MGGMRFAACSPSRHLGLATLLVLLAACGTGPNMTSSNACRKSLAENPTPPEQRLYQVNQQTVGVSEMQLVTATQGWIVAGIQLYWTEDKGCHWRNISPEDSVYWGTEAVFFLDPRHGWVASPTAIFRTVDGGRSWTKNAINYSANSVGLQFVDANNGWLATVDNSPSEVNPVGPGGVIFHTTDGGIHWTRNVDDRLNGGLIRFFTPMVGWALNHAENILYRSDDRGETWTSVTVPIAASYNEIQLGLPSFTTTSDGVLPANLRHRPDSAAFTYYATSDGGRTWTPTHLFGVPPVAIPRVINGTTWFVAHSGPTTTEMIEVTNDGGRSWTQVQTVGLPSIDEIDFATPLVGWARPRSLECVGIADKCSYGEDLLLTVDGGKRWTSIDLKAAGL